MRSPKDKFSGKVCFSKPLKGVGSEVLFTANSVEQIKSYASMYDTHDYTLYISENKKQYPEFDWQRIDVITHKA